MARAAGDAPPYPWSEPTSYRDPIDGGAGWTACMGVTLEQSVRQARECPEYDDQSRRHHVLTIEPTWGNADTRPANLVLTNSFGSIKGAVTLVKTCLLVTRSTSVPGTAQLISIAPIQWSAWSFGQDPTAAKVWSVTVHEWDIR